MRIVLDLQGAQTASRFRGIGRYSLSLALAMVRNAGKHEIWLALNGAFPESVLSIRHAFEGLIPQERIRVFEIPRPVAEIERTNAWRIRASEKAREHFLQKLKPDVIHISSLFEGYNDDAITSVGTFDSKLCTAVTLYDLIPFLNQQDYLTNDTQRDYYLRKIQSLKNADLLLAISEASRDEAIEALKLPQNKVVNISAAADGLFRPLALTTERIQELRNHYGITHNMVMYAPGGFDSRKNFETLITAYSMLSSSLRTNHQLVIVGDIDVDKRLYLQKLSKDARLEKNELIITGYITDKELVEFYNLATLFVFPSKHEGFGLPPLEAMACGTPVIGSKNTSISEVINFQGAIFDPYSPQDISEKLTQVLCDKTFRDGLSVHGLSQAKNFTWDRSAKCTINALEMLVKDKKTPLALLDEFDAISQLVESIAKIKVANNYPIDSDLAQVAECIAFNMGGATHKQLLLDISVIVHGDAKSGIQRVVRSLLQELMKAPPQDIDVRPIYFDGAHYKYASLFAANFIGKSSQDTTDAIVDFYQDDIYLALDLNAHLTAAVHKFHMRLQCLGVKVYFIVYDILLVRHPEWWPEGSSVIFEAWLRSITESATGLICISKSIADEVAEWLTVYSSARLFSLNLAWFHLGADVAGSVPTKGLSADTSHVIAALCSRSSFLMVGTIEPRKGHAQSLAAFEYLWAKGIDINLVIVGKQGWLVDQLADSLRQHPELNQRLFWLEGISDEYLEKIYVASACLIAASEGEGFGLPLIEAAQHKLPIIARDIPVFREVVGEHALYFAGLKAIDLANAVRDWLVLDKAHKAPVSNSIPWLTWKQSTQSLLDIILGDQWYRHWISDGTLRFWGSDNRLGTQVGKRMGYCMASTGQAGYLIYGPYLELASGYYIMKIFGHSECFQANIQLADVEICTDGGAIVFSEGEIYSNESQCEGVLSSLCFYLEKPYQRIEIRVRVNNEAVLYIRKLEVFVDNKMEGKLPTTMSKIRGDDVDSVHYLDILKKKFLKEKDFNLSEKMALAFIVKDEMPVVLHMLESIYNAVGFVSFVDTGSTDDSVENIKKFLSNKFVPYAFTKIVMDDFSFAEVRNNSIKMIPEKFEWILVLDCDEVMFDEDISYIKQLLRENSYDCWELPRYNWKNVNFGSRTIDYPDYQGRLFKNNGMIKYSGKVHEKLSNYSSKGCASDLETYVPHIHHIKMLFSYKYSVMTRRSEFYNQIA
ncbi:MAG: glycosyltransferase [Burkholderiales bacterium]